MISSETLEKWGLEDEIHIFCIKESPTLTFYLTHDSTSCRQQLVDFKLKFKMDTRFTKVSSLFKCFLLILKIFIQNPCPNRQLILVAFWVILFTVRWSSPVGVDCSSTISVSWWCHDRYHICAVWPAGDHDWCYQIHSCNQGRASTWKASSILTIVFETNPSRLVVIDLLFK